MKLIKHKLKMILKFITLKLKFIFKYLLTFKLIEFLFSSKLLLFYFYWKFKCKKQKFIIKISTKNFNSFKINIFNNPKLSKW